MDPYNLAVCFGPTLLPMPAGQDPVALQGRVNQLVQTLILQPARVFPPLTQLPGPVYEKCMAPPSASCLGYALRAACMGGGGVQWRGAPSTAHVPLSALDLRDTQPEGLAGENELELEAGTPTQEDGEGVGKEDHTLSRSWGFSPPPHSDLLFSSVPEGVVEAVACFAYTGRTAQELTFQRGDVLRLHERASGDWWRGECVGTGARGLIPHKYITLPGG